MSMPGFGVVSIALSGLVLPACGGRVTHDETDKSVPWVHTLPLQGVLLPNLVTTPDGDAVVFGFESSPDAAPGEHGILLRFAPNGTVRWRTQFGGLLPAFGSDLAASGDGIFVTALSDGGPLGIEGEPPPCTGGECRVVVAFDSEGRPRWIRYPIAHTLYDGFLSADLGTVTLASTWLNYPDVFIKRWSESGDDVWEVTGHTGDIASPASDGAGGLRVVGTGQLLELTGGTARMVGCEFYSELSPAGELIQSHELGCTGAVPHRAVASPEGGVIVSLTDPDEPALTSFAPDGRQRWSVTKMGAPNFTLDRDGNAYGAEGLTGGIRSLAPSGKTRFVLALGGGPDGGERCFPLLAARAKDDLYALGRVCAPLVAHLPAGEVPEPHGLILARLLPRGGEP